ncbi:hypothetical protein [Caulobacter sp. 1776]|uniref:hypothetical protein n=1 Tax=Caulobacter sp. 1776 TaxID=3156420 RepID=UPI00339078AE
MGPFVPGGALVRHVIGAQGAQPATPTPDLVAIAGRYREWRLDWELEAIAQGGHYRMARKPLTATGSPM